ncbi:MAG TPA: hypothetical protein VK869_05160 [Rubrobacteraceae bacterium]|nr:hypothetical protein [Rubrobacteraceae bacterium]
MNEREEHSSCEGKAAFVKEREQMADGRYIIFYTFDGEEKDREP